MVGDVEDEIVAALNALRARYDYVFTTGGIGPTHDDITADAIAKAFGVGIDYHPEALALLGARYKPGEFNDMRKRMVKPLEEAEQMRGGLYIPDTAKEKPQQGEILAVGPGRYEEGKRIPPDVKVGDKVLYGKYSGTEVTIDGEPVLILRESDVLAVIS